MDKQITKVKSWLPVFPGFYGTSIEPNEDTAIEFINEKRELMGMPELTWHEQIDPKFNYGSYKEKVAKIFVKEIKEILKELDVVETIEYEHLYSPKEYNFHNDSINVIYHLSKENIFSI